MKITSVALILTIAVVGGASFEASAQQLAPPAAVNELYQRYKPRLTQLTPGRIENIWHSQSERQPWYRHLYTLLNVDRDNPQLIQKLQREISCVETTTLTRDVTYSVAAKQYQCAMSLSIPGADGHVVIYLNLNGAGTLESAVIYQTFLAETFARQMAAGGLPANEGSALIELISEVVSRIDNARAPSGSYVEYSKDMDTQKFAVRFK
jgi:hypothetical protein